MHFNKTMCGNTAVYQHLQSEFLLAMSVLQPMDQHIIEALKQMFCRCLIPRLLRTLKPH